MELADRGVPAFEEPSKEAKTHFKLCRFIMEAGVKLGMRSVPLATACTLYHAFFSEVSLDDYDPHLVASSCLYLAGKAEEQHVRLRDIINVVHRHLNPDKELLQLSKEFWELRDSLVQCELLILRVLKFQISFTHPHKALCEEDLSYEVLNEIVCELISTYDLDGRV